MKASDNAFPSILITEDTEPAAPAAGKQRLYIDSTSHHLSRTDSSGTQVDLETNQAGGGAPATHGCQVTRASTNFSVGNNTYTAVEWDAEVFDTDTMHSTVSSPSRVDIPAISGVTTGLWTLRSHGYSSATSGRVDVMFRKNAAGNPASGTLINALTGYSDPTVSGFYFETDAVLADTDYVEVFVRTTGGSFAVAYDAAALPIFSVVFVGKVS